MLHSEVEQALGYSTDCLRMAAQMLRFKGSTEVADLLTQQAEKNQQVLLPWVSR